MSDNFSVPPSIDNIIKIFRITDGAEKLALILEYANSLPPLPPWLAEKRHSLAIIPECVTPVFVYAEQHDDGGMYFYFDIPPESPTIRGFAGLLNVGLSGLTPGQILAIPDDLADQLGLTYIFSLRRVQSLYVILGFMRYLAQQHIG